MRGGCAGLPGKSTRMSRAHHLLLAAPKAAWTGLGAHGRRSGRGRCQVGMSRTTEYLCPSRTTTSLQPFVDGWRWL